MIAGSRDVQDSKRFCSLTTSRRKRCCTALKRCNPLFKYIVGWIHQAGVNVAKLSKREQIRRMLGIPEHKTGCLINGDSTCARRWIRNLACMHSKRIKAQNRFIQCH